MHRISAICSHSAGVCFHGLFINYCISCVCIQMQFVLLFRVLNDWKLIHWVFGAWNEKIWNKMMWMKWCGVYWGDWNEFNAQFNIHYKLMFRLLWYAISTHAMWYLHIWPYGRRSWHLQCVSTQRPSAI